LTKILDALFAMNEKSMLMVNRTPGRLNSFQAAELLGFAEHDIAVLVSKNLLTPLGHPGPNCTKYFSKTDIEKLANDHQWLSKATKVVTEHWRGKNQRRRSSHSLYPFPK
jgi:hypothetical protein